MDETQTDPFTRGGLEACIGLSAMVGVDATLAAQNNLAVTSGVLFVNVTPGSPAATAGLKAGDVIVQVGNHAVTDVALLADSLMAMNPGQLVPVQVYRGSQQLTLNVTLGEARPQ